MDPVAALREIGFWMERGRGETRRVQAYRNAADVVAALPDDERAALEESGRWTDLDGIGPSTAKAITQAVAGRTPDKLKTVRDEAQPIGEGGEGLRAAMRGDLHCHSTWSDGGSPIDEMMRTAQALGHEYCALTDHSPRLTVANGLKPERLRRQLDVIAELNAELAPFRILTGIEVDILDDGSLDQETELLERLDVVVASVHSKLRADRDTMTRRMVTAVADPNVDVLGHCTGRLVEGSRGTRPESTFDAELVFEACARFDTAVEINSRPERRDPPMRLIEQARDTGCLFSIDTDAHAPGQLDFLGYGCARATEAGLGPDRIVNTWPLDDLIAWTGEHRTAV